MKTDNSRNPLLFENILNHILQFFGCYRAPLIAGILCGFLAHGFVFTNKLINHDEIYNLFGKGATVDSGRWGLGALDSIFPNFSMPWIYGIITVLLVAVAACLIIHIFSIHNRILQIMLAGIVVVCPVWASTLSFMFASTSYATAFLTAVMSVFFLRKKHPFFWLIALGCGIFSVAVYQAYIAIIASLLVLRLIQDLILEEDLCQMLRRGCGYVGFLALTLGLYYCATQVILLLLDVEFNQYANERNSFQLMDLPRNIAAAYTHFFRAFETGEFALIPTLFSQKMHRFAYAVCVAFLLLLFHVRKMKWPRILFILALAVLFPLAVYCMYLFTLEAAIHTLALSGFTAIYVPLILLADLCMNTVSQNRCLDLLRRTALNLQLLALSAIIISNIYFANEAALELHLQYESTYAFYTSLMSDIRAQPEFDADTRLAVIGHWDYPDYFYRKFDFTYHLFGHLHAQPTEYSMDRFMEYYLGFPVPFASPEETAYIENSPEYLQMPVYPYYGSIQMFGDTLVVKIS